ncbi:hypothetical protein BH160DRAFT_1010 [Burkholderia sp. H160]|nr:hypothetical protein BH160DRAFT_1010 [Burkholderia sp. H160]
MRAAPRKVQAESGTTAPFKTVKRVQETQKYPPKHLCRLAAILPVGTSKRRRQALASSFRTKRE